MSGVEHRPHRERGVGVGVVADHVDAPRAGVAGALVVHQDLPGVGVHRHLADDVDPAAVGQVEHRRRVVAARVELGDGGPGGRLGPLDDLVGQVLDVVEAVGVAQGGQPLGADLARGHLGVQVAGHVVGLADVGEDELPHIGIALRAAGAVALHQPADRDPQAFLEAVPAARADAVAADVGVVDGGAEQGRSAGARRRRPAPARPAPARSRREAGPRSCTGRW